MASLVQHLSAGDSLDEFLADFPSVTREQAVAFLDLALKEAEAEHRFEDLAPLMPKVNEVLKILQAGQLVRVSLASP